MVVPPKKFYCLLDSQMAHVGNIVGQSNNLSVQTNIIWHDDLVNSGAVAGTGRLRRVL
jgi:hypothetical protein